LLTFATEFIPPLKPAELPAPVKKANRQRRKRDPVPVKEMEWRKKARIPRYPTRSSTAAAARLLKREEWRKRDGEKGQRCRLKL